MTDLAIKVDHLSKQYQIGLKAAQHDTLRDHLVGAMSSMFHRKNGKSTERLDRFWALKDVCFDVSRGEAIGLIGRNGAGKSTFLKILSRITEPTSGFAEIRGRVARERG